MTCRRVLMVSMGYKAASTTTPAVAPDTAPTVAPTHKSAQHLSKRVQQFPFNFLHWVVLTIYIVHKSCSFLSFYDWSSHELLKVVSIVCSSEPPVSLSSVCYNAKPLLPFQQAGLLQDELNRLIYLPETERSEALSLCITATQGGTE